MSCLARPPLLSCGTEAEYWHPGGIQYPILFVLSPIQCERLLCSPIVTPDSELCDEIMPYVFLTNQDFSAF